MNAHSGRPDAPAWTISPLRLDEAEEYAHAHIVMLESTYAHLAHPGYGPLRWAEVSERVASLRRDVEETAEADAAGRPAHSRHLIARSPRGVIVGVVCAGYGVDSWEEQALGDAWTPPGTQWNLRHLYLMPGVQGGGLADELMDAVLPGGHEAYLWVIRHNHRAIRFYEKRGFVDIGPHVDSGPSWGAMPMTRMQRL